MAIKNKIKTDTIYVGAQSEISVPCGLLDVDGEVDVPGDFTTWDVYASFTEDEDGTVSLLGVIDSSDRITLTAEGDIEFTLEDDDTVLLKDADDEFLDGVFLGIWQRDNPVPLFLGKIPIKQVPVAPLLEED